jgi:hypothetical protein
MVDYLSSDGGEEYIYAKWHLPTETQRLLHFRQRIVPLFPHSA